MDLKRTGLYVAVMAAVLVPLYVLDLGGWILLTNDEARFPAMARDIVARGHWLAPAIAGAPMLNKPPLHAWLIALASLPGSAVTPRTAAIPSMIGGLGIVLGTAWLGVRLFGHAAGMTAGLVAATTVGLFALAHVPLPDTTLTLAITAAVCAFALFEFEQRRWALMALYVATGLAFLAKGPVGLIPLGVALVFRLRTHGWRGMTGLVSIPGLLVLGLLTVPWLLLAFQTGGHGFVQTVLVQDFQSTYFGSGEIGLAAARSSVEARLRAPAAVGDPVALRGVVGDARARSAAAPTVAAPPRLGRHRVRAHRGLGTAALAVLPAAGAAGRAAHRRLVPPTCRCVARRPSRAPCVWRSS